MQRAYLEKVVRSDLGCRSRNETRRRATSVIAAPRCSIRPTEAEVLTDRESRRLKPINVSISFPCARTGEAGWSEVKGCCVGEDVMLERQKRRRRARTTRLGGLFVDSFFTDTLPLFSFHCDPRSHLFFTSCCLFRFRLLFLIHLLGDSLFHCVNETSTTIAISSSSHRE